MAAFELKGGCQCGTVRYVVSEPARALSHCHCSMCRKLHGAIYVTFSEVPRTGFRIERGADNLAEYQSSPGNHRHFCRTCGCQLYTEIDSTPDAVYYATGTLDGGAHPGHPKSREQHIFVGSKVPWFKIADDLPQKDEY